MKHPAFKLSICTPAHNAADRIPELYKSLLQQTEQRFEWIVVDDGSSDDTAGQVRTIAGEDTDQGTVPDTDRDFPKAKDGKKAKAPFPIQLLSQKQGGRHTAINRALKSAQGKFFVVLDTDSEPAPEAFARLLEHWYSLPAQERPYFASIVGLSALPDGKIDGNRFPSSPFDSNSIEVGTHYGITGRKWGMIDTTVFQDNPYPVFKGEKFVPDELVLNRIGRDRLTRYINEPLLILQPVVQEKTGSATKAASSKAVQSKTLRLRKWASSPRASSLFFNELTNQRVPLAHRIRASANYVRYSMHAGVLPDDIYKQANKKLFAFFMLWPGLFLYKHDKKVLLRSDMTDKT